MSNLKMIAPPVPNVPWQERPEVECSRMRIFEESHIGRNPIRVLQNL